MFTFEPTKHLSPQYNLELAEKIGHKAAMVFATLSRHFEIVSALAENNGGWFYHEQKWIIKYTGFSPRSVKRAIKKLKECGIIQIRRIGKELGIGPKNYYFITNTCEWIITESQQYEQSAKMAPTQSAKMAPKEYLKTKIIEDKISSAEIFPIRKRMSKIKKTKTKVKRINNTPIKKHVELATETIQSILKIHPKAILPDLVQKKIIEGASVITKLVGKGYKYEEIEAVFKWALTDSFWSDKFRSISGLDKVKNNGNIKFQNMYNSYESANKDMYDQIMQPIKTYIEQLYKEDEVEEILEDIEWFWSEVDKLNMKQRVYKRVDWIYDYRFIKIAKWVIDLDDVAIRHTFKELMKPYLKFLESRLQKNKPDKVYPNLFSDTSELFKEFIRDESYEIGHKILKTQDK